MKLLYGTRAAVLFKAATMSLCWSNTQPQTGFSPSCSPCGVCGWLSLQTVKPQLRHFTINVMKSSDDGRNHRLDEGLSWLMLVKAAALPVLDGGRRLVFRPTTRRRSVQSSSSRRSENLWVCRFSFRHRRQEMLDHPVTCDLKSPKAGSLMMTWFTCKQSRKMINTKKMEEF